MSIRYLPVATAHRDGDGLPLKVEVGGGELRHNVRILAPSGAIIGEVTAAGFAFWDPPPRRPRERVAPASVRQALAKNGKLQAAVDESGNVLCFRAEHRSKSSSPSIPRAEQRGEQHSPKRSGDDVEHFVRPSGRVLSVNGWPVDSR